MVLRLGLTRINNAFLAVLNGRSAGFTNLDFLVPGFLFIEDLNARSLTDRTFSPTMGNQFPNSLTSVGFSHLLLLLFVRVFFFFGFFLCFFFGAFLGLFI